MSITRITTFLWYNDNAEEAVNFYMSVFKNSRITKTSHWGKEGPGQEGSVLTIGFELDGVPFTAMNGGPNFKFTEVISLVVNCTTQAEVDYYWEKLSEGGSKSECGWLKDKFGLSWQITPTMLINLITSDDKEKADKAMQAMMKMSKLDIATLEKATKE